MLKGKNVPRVVVGALIFDHDQRLFLMRSSGKFEDQWIIPGGKVDFGESLIEGLHREILEETNLSIRDVQFCGVRELIQPDRHFIFHEYKAVAANPQEVRLNAEATEHVWVNQAQLSNFNIAEPTLELVRDHWLRSAKAGERE